MNKHFKLIYINIFKHNCKVFFKNKSIILEYIYHNNVKWEATIKNGKYFCGNVGETAYEILNKY